MKESTLEKIFKKIKAGDTKYLLFLALGLFLIYLLSKLFLIASIFIFVFVVIKYLKTPKKKKTT